MIEPNETIDRALDLGTPSPSAVASGSIGDGPEGAADVTWYQFHVLESARVEINVSTPAGDKPFASVISLFNNDPEDFGDLYDVDGHRLLTQVDANPATGMADDVEDLGPGDYFVAISGAGNLDFSPVIAGSGFDGATGSYQLTVGATDLGLAGDGPTVVSSNPSAGAVLDSSPLALRLDLSGPLDPNTVMAGQTVQLYLAPNGTLDGTSTPVALASVNFSVSANELQLFPQAPLAPGNYVIWLAGNSTTDEAVLAGPNGIPLGQDTAHPAGVDETICFHVDGIDGVPGATASDDSVATARNLGDVTGAGVVQASGAIGDDPAFNPNLSADPMNPEPQYIAANQVDLYHFRIVGPGRYAVLAEVFAGRIGSPLDPGISLYQFDPGSDSLIFLAGDNNTLDATQGTDGSIPLFTDAALNDGLTAGDYYLAVAGGSSTPSPLEGQTPDSPGILDPNVPDSAQLGYSTGQYVLNLLVTPAANPPTVIASSPSNGQLLNQPPTQIKVQFSEPMDLQQLAYNAFNTSDKSSIPQVYIEGSDGTIYHPRFISFDRATNQATFQMLDGLSDGSYALHLSGPGGLTDLGGNPIVGNSASKDYVISFQVEGSDRAISGNMTDGYTAVSTANEGESQDLGVVFPNELQAGLTINRGPDPMRTVEPGPTQDDYLIKLTQSQNYSFTLSGVDLPTGTQVTLMNDAGQSVPLLASSDGLVFFGPLVAGSYTIAVGGWNSDQGRTVSYQLTMDLVGQQDNAPPLVDGPAPALQVHLDGLVGGSSGVISNGTLGDGSSGVTPVTLPGPTQVAFAQTGTGIVIAGLGISPLGGVASEGGISANQFDGGSTAPIQIALNVTPAPVFSGLVSLLTMTQMISLNRDGGGAEPSSGLPLSGSESNVGPVNAAETAIAAQPALAASETLPARQMKEPALSGEMIASIPVEAAELARPLAAHILEAHTHDGGDKTNSEPVADGWGTSLLITGVLIAAFRGRRAIRELHWQKRVRAEAVRPGGPVGPHVRRNRMKVMLPHGGMVRMSGGRSGQLAPHTRSLDA